VLKIRFLGAQIKLINDLEAMALGMLHLSDDELLELNPNAEAQAGNIAVIAPGTGLGQALLFWDGYIHHSIATEGGHTDFAPVNNRQDLLLEYLRSLYPDHVSYERILSGIGFSHLYDFICAKKIAQPSILVPQLSDAVDRNAIISQLGVEGTDKACIETLKLFVEILGAETGNLTLKSLATGGVFIGGGICPNIITALQDGVFIDAFRAKGRFNALLNTISIKLSLNPRTPLLGAIKYFS
ncbi:MAG: glucokinase, partial [Actinobacteria bacterium]|nr:glucokinase [Actinomycetota bacterium]